MASTKQWIFEVDQFFTENVAKIQKVRINYICYLNFHCFALILLINFKCNWEKILLFNACLIDNVKYGTECGNSTIIIILKKSLKRKSTEDIITCVSICLCISLSGYLFMYAGKTPIS